MRFTAQMEKYAQMSSVLCTEVQYENLSGLFHFL